MGRTFPTQGPGWPVAIQDFSSSVSLLTNLLAFTKAVSQPPLPVMFAV
jgi:hypothetical protein